MEQILFREDPLARLGAVKTYQEQLSVVHDVLRGRCPGIDRISISLYDQKTRSLKTFLASPLEQSPLKYYDISLNDSSALIRISEEKKPRIVHDLRCYENHDARHSRAILGHGFASSYTHPIFYNRELVGFVFFNSFHNRYFRERILEQLEIYSHLISELIMKDLAATRALVAAMRTSVTLVHKHDIETGSHLERMSRYAHLIARSLASNGIEELNDEQVEQIGLFSPLHDVGKIAIPDAILKKTDRLNTEERQVMNSHTTLGRQIVDELIDNFEFDSVPYINYLRHIVELHHEAIDGSGYPHGLSGKEIALEARIIAVSDIFDALTTQRPYKEPWSNDHAFAMLKLLAIDKLDEGCVSAIVNSQEEVRLIQEQFIEAA